ncbi:MAG: site-specific integrase [Bacteroidales bacterium]|nr:site-specific integrase [Bacteroidales bacterium]MCQ2605468.1 site-specific integrase [Bacteroidales bacterium]
MKIVFYLKQSKQELENVYVRIADSKRYDLKIKTPIVVYSDCFKNGEIRIPKIASKEKIENCIDKQQQLFALYSFLFQELQYVDSFTTEEAKTLIKNFVSGNKNKQQNKIILLFDKMVSERDISPNTKKKFKTLRYVLQDYEKKNDCVLTIDNFTPKTIFEILQTVKNGNRGINTFCKYAFTMRTFCLWLQQKKYVSVYLLDGYEMPTERYGTPYYLTQEEREQLATAELPQSCAVQRDIFIFQCLIGCRVADLLQLTKNNINNGFVEYIADKTLKNPKVIKVPLCKQAQQLIDKYNNPNSDKLFPFISAQKYNEHIKMAAKLAGLNRQIQKFNTRTGKKEFAPLHELISSHCARRTFIGILYKKTKDVNVIASMSGHVENSKAFSRYRAIDDDDKRELIDLL